MGDLTNTSRLTFVITSPNNKSKIKTRGVVMLTRVTKAHKSGVHFLVYFCPITSKAYGEHADSFGGYMSVQGKRKVSILIDN